MSRNERAGVTVPESVRARAWRAAKPVALEEWQKGSADTTQMLIACSRALDAALAIVYEAGMLVYMRGDE